ncbi:MAG: hypothetical protein SFU56_02610 [Capsulimonadales bacterium]|nr:hypothetical protein [Capsulimonadales bacterium]
MVYELLSAVGGLGLLAQTVLGFIHGDHDAQHGGLHLHGHLHVHGHAPETVHVHGLPNTEVPPANHAPTGGPEPPSSPFVSLLSPLALFTLCLGAGVTGLLLQMQLRERWLVALIAALGGLALYYLVVAPLRRLIFAFASKPAATLSAAVAREGEADSRFDREGRGIVRLNVDGQIVRILAQLEPEEIREGEPVTAGQKLVVTAIDRRRNTCRVTRL